uniref:Uncharacterized protein n=1 Tax=Panagrellus redivivus TaxID=6233 RepID=A0A7E4VV64_PANRE
MDFLLSNDVKSLVLLYQKHRDDKKKSPDVPKNYGDLFKRIQRPHPNQLLTVHRVRHHFEIKYLNNGFSTSTKPRLNRNKSRSSQFSQRCVIPALQPASTSDKSSVQLPTSNSILSGSYQFTAPSAFPEPSETDYPRYRSDVCLNLAFGFVARHEFGYNEKLEKKLMERRSKFTALIVRISRQFTTSAPIVKRLPFSEEAASTQTSTEHSVSAWRRRFFSNNSVLEMRRSSSQNTSIRFMLTDVIKKCPSDWASTTTPSRPTPPMPEPTPKRLADPPIPRETRC